MKASRSFLLLLVTLVTLFGLGISMIWTSPPSLPAPPPTPPPALVTLTATTSAVLGVKTQSIDCTSENALPDPECTPGAIFANVTVEQLCMPGYTSTVRNVSKQTKDYVFMEYGLVERDPNMEYEVDHFISLALGGSNDLANLWPEPEEPRPGFREKDVVENYLYREMCKGNISLPEAQTAIRTNWLEVYERIKKP